MILPEARKYRFGCVALRRSSLDLLEMFRRFVKHLLKASPLIFAMYLVWQHRAHRCGLGVVHTVRLFEKDRIGADAPNLLENFCAGFFYVCIAYYGFLFLHWINQEIRTAPPAKGRLQLLIRGFLFLATPLIFMNGRKYAWSDVSYGASMIFAVGYLAVLAKPAPAFAWLSRHYKTTIGSIAMMTWIYWSLAWKVRELRDSTFKLSSCTKDARGRAVEVSGHVTWAHAWPQLLIGLAGMAGGLYCVSFYWTEIRAKGSCPQILSSGSADAGS